MPLNVELLETSFAAVAPQADLLAETFYGHLFEDYPSVVPLFADVDMPEQRRKLIAALKLVIENLRRPEDLVPALEQMGCRHVGYGAEEPHYGAVGATLLKSLAEVAGDLWTTEVEQAWTDAYGAIQTHMLNGAMAGVA